MVNSVLNNFIHISLFIIYIMLPVNVAAEDVESNNSFTEQVIFDEELDDDDSTESSEDIVEDSEDIVDDSPIKAEAEKPFFSFLDTHQEFISSGVETAARNIDEFFSDDKVFYESSGTYLRLRADAIINERGERTYQGDVKLKLRVPNTKKKLKFTLESDPNEKPDEISGQGENTPIEAIEEKDYFAGLQAELGKKESWKFKPSIGLRLGSPVEFYFKFRIKRKYEFNKWSLHIHETPYWFESSGWGSDSYLELNRKVTGNDLFRASTFARWTNESNKFELSQVFSMFHTLSKRRAVSYFTGVYGESEPTVSATHYLLGLSYRQNIHKDYLFVELMPQIKYEKSNDFHAEHSITLRLEIVFKK